MSSKEITSHDAAQQSAGSLQFDPDKYLEHVADVDVTEAQKVVFLRTLWDIMGTFVRLGFGVESVLPALFENASRHAVDGLEESIPTHEFNVAASEAAPSKEE